MHILMTAPVLSECNSSPYPWGDILSPRGARL